MPSEIVLSLYRLLGSRRRRGFDVDDSAVKLPPEMYEQWRASGLGSVTEAREFEVVFSIVGPLKGRRLLDVGCGDGVYLVEAARRGACVTGTDLSEPMLLAARRRATNEGVDVTLSLADAQALPFGDGAFDVIVATTILCLVPDALRVLDEMARVLAPGGRLVLGELGRWNTWSAWRRVRGWFGSPTWRHATFRSRRSLESLIRQAGLEPEQVTGVIYYPPIGPLARPFKPLDAVLGEISTVGAAFIAIVASKPQP